MLTPNSCDSSTTKTMPEQSQSNPIEPNDVLLGRGGATNNHMGNLKYRSIVAEHQDEYLQARKRDKVLIARRVVAIVKSTGGRFLKRDQSEEWVPVTDKRAQEKTSQALREGLDVRNNTIRPSKQIKALRPNNKTKFVTGTVVTPKSPSRVSSPSLYRPLLNASNLYMPQQQSLMNVVAHNPVFLLYQPPPVRPSDHDHLCPV